MTIKRALLIEYILNYSEVYDLGDSYEYEKLDEMPIGQLQTIYDGIKQKMGGDF